MTVKDHQADALTAEKLGATDGDVGDDSLNLDPDEDAVESGRAAARAYDEAEYEYWLSRDARSAILEEIRQLWRYVRRGVRSVSRSCAIDDDTLSGLAQQAYTRVGDNRRQAFRLGREWAQKNLLTLEQLERQDRRHDRYDRRDREAARRAKETGVIPPEEMSYPGAELTSP